MQYLGFLGKKLERAPKGPCLRWTLNQSYIIIATKVFNIDEKNEAKQMKEL